MHRACLASEKGMLVSSQLDTCEHSYSLVHDLRDLGYA
jgi:hypothetical protein